MPGNSEQTAAPASCRQCGSALDPDALACSQCGSLTHAARLDRLVSEARVAESHGDRSRALGLWREAAMLVPGETRESHIVERELKRISAYIDEHGAGAKPEHPNWLKRLGPIAPIAFLLWKFKAFLLLLLTKGKLLLFGLTKVSTLGSMLLSLGAYWTLYGWWFALGLVLSIYVHEMGHVYAMRQFGIPASAPMFVPLFGAFVRMQQTVLDVRENARIGLAGPIWGTAGAIAAFVCYALWDIPVIGAIAHFAAWINLFNLMPVWQLDGARAFSSLSRSQRVTALLVILLAFALSREGFLLILAALATWRIFTKDAPPAGDPKCLTQFCGLVIVLSILLMIPTPLARR